MGSHVTRASADVQHVLDGVRRIVQGLRESSVVAQRRTGLTAAQLFVLRRLSDADAMSVTDLAVRTFTHQSSVSTVVSRLVQRRLVERRADPHDRRRRILVVTRAGRAALAGAPHAAQERLVEAVQELPPRSRRQLGHTLERLADAMDARRTPLMFFEAGGRR